MKKTLVLILCLAMLLPSLGAFAAESILPWKGEPIVYEGYAADLGITENRESPVYKAYKEAIGDVTINWSTGPWSDFDEKTKIFLNTGDLPDIVWLRNSSTVVRDYGSMGYFLNLNEYKEQMPNLTKYREEFGQLKYMEAADGAYYALNDIEPYDSLQEAWYVNKSKLDELGLEVPKTYDELTAAMDAFLAKYPSGTPFITYGWGFSYYKYALSWINNANYGGMYYDGSKWAHSIANPESGHKELIAMLADWYAKGYLHPDFTTISDEQSRQIITQGDFLFNVYYIGAIEREVFQGGEMPYVLEPMLAPAMKAGDPQYQAITVMYDSVPGWGYFANSKVAHPEVMAALMDFIVSEEGSDLFNWGVKGLTYDVDENGNKYFLEDYGTNSERRKEVGLGNFMDIRYIQLKNRYTEYAREMEGAKKAYELVTQAAQDGAVELKYTKRGVPVLSLEQKELAAQSLNPLKTYADEQEMLFVDGTRPMDEWDAFVEEWKKFGNVEQVVEIYEAGEQIVYSDVRKPLVFGK